MPRIEINLDDALVERQIALHHTRLARFLRELSDCVSQLAHKERLSGAPIPEKTDGERRRRVAGCDQRGQGEYILFDADEVQPGRGISSELDLPARLCTD